MRFKVGPAIRSAPITTAKTSGMVMPTIKAARRPKNTSMINETIAIAIIRCSTSWDTVRSALTPSSRVITSSTSGGINPSSICASRSRNADVSTTALTPIRLATAMVAADISVWPASSARGSALPKAKRVICSHSVGGPSMISARSDTRTSRPLSLSTMISATCWADRSNPSTFRVWFVES